MSVDGIWYVKLADGDVERVTLDELDEAFQCGRVDENSMVLADGADTWMKLCDLLGSSEAAPPVDSPAGPPLSYAQAPTSPAAIATRVEPAPIVAPPVAALPPQAIQFAPAPVVVAPARPVMAASPFTPAVAPAAAIAPVGIASMRPPVAMPPVAVVNSVRPVTFDLGAHVDMDDHPFRASGSRKRWVVGAVGSLLVLGAGGFIAFTQVASGAPSTPAPVFAAANAAPPAQPPTPAEAYAPAPPTQGNLPGPSSIMDPTQQHALTDEQKQKLLEADKKLKSHATNGGGSSTWHPPNKDKSSGFTTGGNKYDPLNSSL